MKNRRINTADKIQVATGTYLAFPVSVLISTNDSSPYTIPSAILVKGIMMIVRKAGIASVGKVN
jgi:hypothetical protein